MIAGARQGRLSGLRRLAAGAMARDLCAYLVPGSDLARAQGLDIQAAGMRLVSCPRHASVLVIVGPLASALRDAASVIYAQMMRPRAVFALGRSELSPLPAPDVTAGLSQQDLIKGVRQLRTAFAEGAFSPDVADFDAPILHVRVEYTCPMHPDVVQNEPGACPKCGMTLIPREAQASIGHAHADQPKMDTGTALQTASTHDEGSHAEMDRAAPAEYTCPMHPEVVQNKPASCPKCGMNLEPRETPAESNHDQHSMDHAGMAFMSMVDVTKDLPRSGDGLPMDWIDVPFGPFFPGLPGGLLLTLTLDGDTVAGSSAQVLMENVDLLQDSAMDSESFVERLADMQPLSPLAYRFLACRAIENAAGAEVPAATTRGRIGALERERIASHLSWLVLFGQQTGCDWLQRCAASLQLKCRQADRQQVLALKPDIETLIRRLQRTPLLKSRTAGIGRLVPDRDLRGPVARAAGIGNDARSTDPTYSALGFKAVTRETGDSLARLHVRLDEISHSLTLIEAAGDIGPPALTASGEISATGEAVVETPRGLARLQLTLEKSQVIAAQLDTASTQHLNLVDTLTDQQALGDALLAVGSLDLSPWEVQP